MGRDFSPDFRHQTSDFVAWCEWVPRPAPLAAHRMNIGVADASVLDINQHIVSAEITPFDRGRDQRISCRRRRVSLDSEHISPADGSRWVYSTLRSSVDSDRGRRHDQSGETAAVMH